MIAKETYFFTKDGRVVLENDPSASFLIVRKGCFLNDSLAKKYGIAEPLFNKAITSVKNKKK
jgi:hypothetical protein